MLCFFQDTQSLHMLVKEKIVARFLPTVASLYTCTGNQGAGGKAVLVSILTKISMFYFGRIHRYLLFPVELINRVEVIFTVESLKNSLNQEEWLGTARAWVLILRSGCIVSLKFFLPSSFFIFAIVYGVLTIHQTIF